MILKPTDEITDTANSFNSTSGANATEYQPDKGDDDRNTETKPEVKGKSLSNQPSTIKTSIDEESTTDNSSVCTRDFEEKETTEKSEKQKTRENSEKNSSSQKEKCNVFTELVLVFFSFLYV